MLCPTNPRGSGTAALAALAFALLSFGVVVAGPSEARASTTAESSRLEASADEGGSTNWGPIIGGCLGVLFGGAIAMWQIRGMRNRD